MSRSHERTLSSSWAVLTALLSVATAVGGLAAGCNDHPVAIYQPSGGLEIQEEVDYGESSKLDLLWVIDNSGSMCQEQAGLRENFEAFVDNLRTTSLDFHVAVTTTQMHPSAAGDPVARAGHLQSEPQPVPGFHGGCQFAKDDNGTVKDGEMGRPGPDYGPVNEQIEQAVECTANPDKWQKLKEPSQSTLDCAIKGDSAACQAAGKSTDFDREDLFPPRDAYRDIPVALRAQDYTDSESETLDVDAMRRDFACMSMVGTRGDSFEQGLAAAARAVSPEMTGGPADIEEPADPQAPNHGFLRQDARFGLVVVSDENDCSHDGSLERQQACGQQTCYFATREGEDAEPLVSVDQLYERFRSNLAASKGVDSIPDEDLLAAAIHGGYEPYRAKATPPQTCQSGKNYVEPLCNFENLKDRNGGIAYSGDRYADFAHKFARAFPDDREEGLLCRPDLDFSGVLENLGLFFQNRQRVCVSRELPSCRADGDCSPPRYSGGRSACVQSDELARPFCRSAVQLGLTADASEEAGPPVERLRRTGLCAAESISNSGGGARCVVSPEYYRWRACDGNDSAVSFEWVDPPAGAEDYPTEQVRRRLSVANLDLQVRYAPAADGAPDESGGSLSPTSR